MKLIRDPVHEYIRISDQEAKLIDTPLIQRLRHVAQNGPTRLVYPSLLGTRFEHTLGVAHISTRILETILNKDLYDDSQSDIPSEFLKVAAADLEKCLNLEVENDQETKSRLMTILRHAAFFNDVGHIPLSHSLEDSFAAVFHKSAWSPWMPGMKWHEMLGAELVRQTDIPVDKTIKRGALLVLLASGVPAQKARWTGIIDETPVQLAQSVFGTLRSILAGEYDADRADYLLRDGYMSGAGFGTFDLPRFLDSMRLVKRLTPQQGRPHFMILPTIKALSTLESTLLERYKLYKWVYFHHKVCFFDELVYRSGREIFAKPEIARQLVSPKIVKESPQALFERTVTALTNSQDELPPCIILSNDTGRQWHELNREFFFPEQGSYLDDGWFCHQLRTQNEQGFMKPCKEALVFRKTTCFSMWKESLQFEAFLNEVQRQVPENFTIQEHTVSPDRVKEFLTIPWQDLRRHSKEVDIERGKRTFARIYEDNLKNIACAQDSSLVPIVRCNDWNLVANLEGLEVLKRDGTLVSITKSSPILKALSGLSDNLPLYVFFLGSERDIAELKQAREEKDNPLWHDFLGAVAKSLVQTVMQCAAKKDDIPYLTVPLQKCLIE